MNYLELRFAVTLLTLLCALQRIIIKIKIIKEIYIYIVILKNDKRIIV